MACARALENAHSALPLRAPCLGYGLDVKVQFENPLLPVLFYVVSTRRFGLCCPFIFGRV